MKNGAKWINVLVILLLIMSIALVGCSKNNDDENNSSQNVENTNNANQNDADQNNSSNANNNSSADNSKEGVMLDFYFDKSGWAPGMDMVGELAKEEYGVGFKTVVFSDTNAFTTTIKQALGGKNPPDLFNWWAGYRMEDIIESGKIADLTDEWEHYTAEGLNPDLADAFKFDGKMYGAPLYVAYETMFYNKKVFDELGLEEPETWDEFMNIVTTLKDNDVIPLANPFEGRWPTFTWFEEFFVHMYPDLYEDLMIGKASYTDPRVVEVMELWKSFTDKGYFDKPGSLGNDILPKFTKGELGIVLMGSWYSSSLINAGLVPGEDFGAFIMPSMKEDLGKIAIYETAPIMISKDAPNKEEALQALRNFYKQDAQQVWSESQGFPAMVSGVESKNVVIDNVVSKIKDEEYRIIHRFWEATPPEISEFAVDQFGKFLLEPDKYMEVLEDLEKHSKEYWESRN